MKAPTAPPHRRWRVPWTVSSRARRSFTPARLLAVSFAGLIAVGTLGLRLLPGLTVDGRLSWLDALFTATSAVCVTGLIVVDTATFFTPAGQAFLLLLIQLGGLGILTFTTLAIAALGRRPSLHHEAASASAVDLLPDIDAKHLVRKVVVFALAFEAVGALILFLAWAPRYGVTDAAWHGLFHAISAFCNAGFSTFSDSLVGARQAPIVLGLVMGLIVLGGLGFLTMEELHLRWSRRRDAAPPRLSLHSRVVLVTSAALIAAGWVAFGILEWDVSLAGMPPWARVINSLFMSVTPRTAGFNTIDYATASEGSNFITIVLMSVGGSPGSTAGGLKTTTVAVLALLALARLRGHSAASVYRRSIPEHTVERATGLFVIGFVVLTGAILCLTVLQGGAGGQSGSGAFLSHMFEAVSAFNTVGLSMGTTGELTGPSRMLTIALMYLGRVGPLTVVAAVAARQPVTGREFRYAEEDVIIG